MSLILAHPFRVVGNAVAVVDDADDDGLAQLVAVLVTTRRGERHIRPAFGVPDPAFGSYNVADINAGLSMFGPDVTVTGLTVDQVTATSERVSIAFKPRGST